MQAILILLLGLCTSGITADRDTLPLKDKTRGPVKQEVKPLAKPDMNSDGPSGSGTSPGQPSSSGEKSADLLKANPEPYVAGLDTYGSSRINELIVKNTLGKELQTWLTKGLEGDAGSVELEEKLALKIKNKFDFAAVDWSIIQYFEPGDLAIYITLDVVEKSDVKTRMPFSAEPKETFADPSGLITKWKEYENTAMQLVESGQIEPETETCPAFHCPFGHKHEKLKPYQTIFVDGVKKEADKLFQILAKDKRGEWRAAAAYLVAYYKDGKRVVAGLVDRIRDPDALVRNNALRVLGDIAELRKELVIPSHPVLEALNFPRVSDRSKALYLTYLLSLNSQQLRDDILRTSVPTLLQLLAAQQPDHREISHGILRKISGRDFASNDIRSWSSWFQRLPRERIPTSGSK